MTALDSFSLFGPLPRHAEFMEAAGGILAQVSPLTRLRALRGASPGWERGAWRALAEAG